MGNSLCPNVSRRQPRRQPANEEPRTSTHSTPTRSSLNSVQLHRQLSRPFSQNSEVMVYVGPGMRQPLSQLTEDEQIQICIRLGLIDSLQLCTYDDTKRDKFCECAICMEEYVEGCKLRILPCLHAYHRECIDDWLQRSFTCPSCQQDLLQQLTLQQQQQQTSCVSKAGSDTPTLHERGIVDLVGIDSSSLTPHQQQQRQMFTNNRRRFSGSSSQHRRQNQKVRNENISVVRSRSSSSLPSTSMITSTGPVTSSEVATEGSTVN